MFHLDLNDKKQNFKEFKNTINSLFNETHESKKECLTEKINEKKWAKFNWIKREKIQRILN